MHRRRAWAAAIDGSAVVVGYYLVANFHRGGHVLDGVGLSSTFLALAIVAVVVHLSANSAARAYSILARFMGLSEALRIAAAVAVSALLLTSGGWILRRTGLDLESIPVGAATAGCMMVAWRFYSRIRYRRSSFSGAAATERIVLVGAGQGADMLIRELNRTKGLAARVVAVLDDNPRLLGACVQGAEVLGAVEDAPRVVEETGATQIIIAVPSAAPEEVSQIYRQCRGSGVPIKIMPNLSELVRANGSRLHFRDLDITDVLRRPKVRIDTIAVAEYLCGRRVLVTGAGGSIGSELVRQLAQFRPDRLILVDHDESSLYELHEQLQELEYNHYALLPTNILDERKLKRVFEKHRPDVVFHAAAYKHVPLMEINPDEAVLNNILGTHLVTRTAARCGVEKLVNISTDKAVEPACVMGATKRAGELIVRRLCESHTRLKAASVRFGNVLGSQGSVIPIFRKQIAGGGPVVITHPEMKRYFMLVEEAVQLVLQSLLLVDEDGPGSPSPGDIFVLEMGEPVPIVELAQQMISLLRTDSQASIAIEFTGLRPGEKLEELLTWPDELTTTTAHPLIRRIHPLETAASLPDSWTDFENQMAGLINMARDRADRRSIIDALVDAVPGYYPADRPAIQQREEIRAVVPGWMTQPERVESKSDARRA